MSRTPPNSFSMVQMVRNSISIMKMKFGGVRDIDIPFEGVIGNIKRRYHETNSDYTPHTDAPLYE